jgi:dynein heavy chain
MSIQPRSSSTAGKSREEVIGDLATYVQSKVPPEFDMTAIYKEYPTDYAESMNTVLV